MEPAQVKKSDHIAKGVRVRTYGSGVRRIEIQFRFQGIQCREILPDLDPDMASARKYAVNLKAAIGVAIYRGTFDYAHYFPTSPRNKLFRRSVALTVADAQEGLIQDLETAGRERTTIASYRRSAARIDQHLGHLRILDLTPEHIRQMVRSRAVGRKTWNNDLIPLRRALNRCVNDGLVPFNALDRVMLDELVAKGIKAPPDPFTMGEISGILSAAPDERTRNLYEFAFFTGLRLEELVALQWDNVNLVAGTAEITHAGMLSLRSVDLKGPKTAAGARVIDLLPRAMDPMKRQKQVTWFKGENVFCRWQSLEPFRSYESLGGRWQTVLERAGVRYRPMKNTRHTYASHQLSSGVNQQYVAQQMGHSGTALLDVYARWVKDWVGEYGERKYGS
jgi:integrase